ncbi:hypothetical protein KOI35_21105 [Actinoplanes bogorensis]|uniref:Uncharacterized protein n=1 Tax=Paractinoplanes bogorensis TaxID=1610840 RepID=A0ABS5YVC1_9ACTN|nr:hypothetical protein [Actinoplanes bogorensis]MBU2666015.1 hypothetical protein [Actinoplanes bogorensis]
MALFIVIASFALAIVSTATGCIQAWDIIDRRRRAPAPTPAALQSSMPVSRTDVDPEANEWVHLVNSDPELTRGARASDGRIISLGRGVYLGGQARKRFQEAASQKVATTSLATNYVAASKNFHIAAVEKPSYARAAFWFAAAAVFVVVALAAM